MPGKEIAKNPPQTPNKPSDKKKKNNQTYK